MTNLIAKLLIITSSILLTSCGQIINNSIDGLSNQIESQQSSFSPSQVQGIWQLSGQFEHYDVQQIFQEGHNLIQSSFELIDSSNETAMKESFSESCDIPGNENIRNIASKFYLIMKDDKYEYISLSKFSLSNGEQLKCWVELSKGNFQILGDYLHLKTDDLIFNFLPTSDYTAEIGYIN